MGVVWYRVWRDLWNNKLHTSLVVLVTATGVFAVGLVVGLNGTMTTHLDEEFSLSSPLHLGFCTGLFDKSLVETIRRTFGEPAAGDADRSR